MRPLARADAPFYDAPRFRDVTWIEPSLVAQCGFAEWTNDGRLRHPRYLGLREDKDPLKVVREASPLNAETRHEGRVSAIRSSGG